jgi:hypothetical protein
MSSRVTVKNRRDPDSDYSYWMSKSPEERIDAVEYLREQCYLAMGYEKPPGIVRVAHVAERKR